MLRDAMFIDILTDLAPMAKDLETRILERIRPSSQESSSIEGAAAEVVKRVNAEAPAFFTAAGGPITPIVVGSVAKGTYLKEADIDVFMTFPVSASRETLEKVGLTIGRKVLEQPLVKYAEHPYIRGRIGQVNVDLVPCYAITEPGMKMSAVDRTPFQSRYVNSRITESQRNEVRLLKKFFKGIGVYGAEAKTNGFSGYLSELLVMAYGSFADTVNAISSWQGGESVHVQGTTTGRKLVSSDAILTLPDPVDDDRNVAAAVGPDAFSLAVIASRRYLRKADVRFFFPREAPTETLPSIRKKFGESGHSLILLTMRKPDVVDDNLYPQIQKARRSLTALLARHDFEVNRCIFDADGELKILFEIKHGSHPSYWLREGPAGWSQNSWNFIDKHRKAGGQVGLIDGILYSEEKRDYTDPESLMKRHISELSLGADIDRVKDSLTISVDRDVITSGNRSMLSRLYFTRFPWEY